MSLTGWRGGVMREGCRDIGATKKKSNGNAYGLPVCGPTTDTLERASGMLLKTAVEWMK